MALEWPDGMVGWVRPAYRAGSRLLATWDSDVILASGPPFSTFAVAASLARRAGIPWVADYRDLWTNSSYYRYPAVKRRFDRRIEKALLRTAALATTVSQPLADELTETFGVETQVIKNGFDEVALEPAHQRNPLGPAHLNLVYVGDTLYGGRRTPALMLKAARSLGWGARDITFHFVGTNPTKIAQIVEAEEASELVRVHPPVGRSKSIELQSRADALMLLMWNDSGEAGVYSGKLYEYVAVGRPILMSGYAHGVAAVLITDRGLGQVVNSVEECRAALTQLARTKPSNGLAPDLHPICRMGLDRSTQCLAMVDLLGRVVHSSGAAALR